MILYICFIVSLLHSAYVTAFQPISFYSSGARMHLAIRSDRKIHMSPFQYKSFNSKFAQFGTSIVSKYRLFANSAKENLSTLISDSNLPDRLAFTAYYEKTVGLNQEMNLAQFLDYKPIKSMIEREDIKEEDVDSIWGSFIADSPGANLEEAYEILCMVFDIPDPSEEVRWREEFSAIASSQNKDFLTFYDFLAWTEIKDMLDDGAITIENLITLWKCVVFDGKLSSIINADNFVDINNRIDSFLEDGKIELTGTDDEQKQNQHPWSDLPIWSDEYLNPEKEMESEDVSEITKELAKISSDGWIGYDVAVKSRSVTLTIEPPVDSEPPLLLESELKELWSEAIKFEEYKDNGGQLGKGKAPKDKSGKERPSGKIGKDAFLRFLMRLEVVFEEAWQARDSQSQGQKPDSSETPNDDESSGEAFYASEFLRITKTNGELSLDEFLEWNEVADLIEDGLVSEKQVTAMFNALPKGKKNGITVEGFVALNNMLDAVLDVGEQRGSGSKDNNANTAKKTAVPNVLVSEPARPMPREGELNSDMLKAADKKATIESGDKDLTGEDLQMLEILDQAETLLGARSFGAFDKLIGDENDPRLQPVLGQSKLTAESPDRRNHDALRQLVELSEKQSRCGLDRPTEEVATQLRALFQSSLDQIKPSLVSSVPIDLVRQRLNGRWRLLYTNSEMFTFYNGVTGLTNVFPASTFQSLELDFQSDGFLSESQYLESLSTPLGPVLATVSATWELIKEASFMTNEDSLVLRNYVTKVKAGPFEYRAEENWKSLRTFALNEVLYVDEDVFLARNAGALRIFFVFNRVK